MEASLILLPPSSIIFHYYYSYHSYKNQKLIIQFETAVDEAVSDRIPAAVCSLYWSP